MGMFFGTLLQNSLSGTMLILLILLFRRFTGKLSRAYVHVLWLILLAVLLIPPVAVSPVGTVRDFFSGVSAEKMCGALEKAQTQTGKEITWQEMTETVEMSATEKSTDLSARQDGAKRMAVVWAAGAVFLAAVCLIQWGMLRRRVRGAIRVHRGVWQSDGIKVPFVMPGFPAKIYIPSGLVQREEQLADILAHERAHIRHGDHVVKCVAVLALILHWFNPFVWLAVRHMSLDVEMFCDERVLRGKGVAERKRYSQTLLDYASRESGFAPAVYFGERGTRDRIYHIFTVKKPCAPAMAFLVLLVCGCGLSFMTAQNADLREEPPKNAAAEDPKDAADVPEEFIEDAVTLYLTGRMEELNHDYLASDFKVRRMSYYAGEQLGRNDTESRYQVESNRACREVELVSADWLSGDSESEEKEVFVTAKSDGVLTCMNISVKKTASKNGTEEWSITGWEFPGDVTKVMASNYKYDEPKVWPANIRR